MARIILTLLALALPMSAQRGMGSSTKAVPRAAPKVPAGVNAPPIDLRDMAPAWGVTAPNYYGGESSKRHILEMSGNGVALLDFDNDAKLDILLVNGARFDGTSRASALYRNLGAGKFALAPPLATSGWSQGACAGDFDNDGFTDLLVTRYGGSQLFRNDGGRFRAAPFPPAPDAFHTGCTFLDYDRDGLLDLFVSSYVAFPMSAAISSKSTCTWLGVNVFCGPRGFATGVNYLFHNEGGGRFTDVSMRSGIRVDGLHYGFAAITADFDDDGWPDIYVACDSTPSLLYRNNHDGTFIDAAVPSGTAYGENGEEQGGMGAAAADYDRDGRIDIVRTNFIDETSTTLYRNLGDLFFADQTVAAGLAANTRLVAWGTEFLDLDQDGRLDLVAANGHIYPELARAKTGDPYTMPRLVYWNAGGVFLDVTKQSGPGAAEARPSRGLATGDLDGDGAQEIVIVNMNQPPTILKNHAPKGNWLLVKLTGTTSNRTAIGAKVIVTAGGERQLSVIPGGSSYLSQPDFRRHFGLGKAHRAESIEVIWPGGKRDVLTDVEANRVIEIREGSTGR